ncbi:MAG: very short patch repair endonuclease [Candidatus Andersenbacteria bacterium]|nr:very short patch repair endonuclease [Candidatus Andersenbacteria bacterium]
MPDIFTKTKRSYIMSRIKGKNTKPEVLVFGYLRGKKIYFQKHYSKVPGNPDIALPKKKIAVFIDGDFWHGRTYSKRKATLPGYWVVKIARNIARDKSNRAKLKRKGWKILKVWESELYAKTREKTLKKIYYFLSK